VKAAANSGANRNVSVTKTVTAASKTSNNFGLFLRLEAQAGAPFTQGG
jgi:hypothetical protein